MKQTAIGTNYYDRYQKNEINWKRFKPVPNLDYDTAECTRSFSGRMTKARWKRLDRICRANRLSRMNCGHDWDCCGCLCGQYMSFTYKHNQVVITIYQSFNY